MLELGFASKADVDLAGRLCRRQEGMRSLVAGQGGQAIGDILIASVSMDDESLALEARLDPTAVTPSLQGM